MGQYYKGVILKNNKKSVECWVSSRVGGLKLMEHSWMENDFVRSFEKLIHNNPKRVVWAGDYADECKGLKTNVYDRCTEKLRIEPEYPLSILDSIFVVNHTKKQYVSKIDVPSNNGWRIHPLPLLTCEGNGRGGGDFRGESDLVGSWARDLISVTGIEPLNYKKIIFDIKED